MKSASHALLALGLSASALRAAATAPIDVYKHPDCACCSKWADHLRAKGFELRTHDTVELASHKAKLGVPAGYEACHKARAGAYLIEGHVPAADIKRMLGAQPRARGLAGPAMPAGSPGVAVTGQIGHCTPFSRESRWVDPTLRLLLKGSQMKTRLMTLALGMGLAVGLPVWAGSPAQHQGHGSAAMEDASMAGAAVNAAESKAEVRKVDLAQGKVTLKHGPIENLGMPGMTMVFRVENGKLLDGLQPGDQVRFRAEKKQGGLIVTQITPAK